MNSVEIYEALSDGQETIIYSSELTKEQAQAIAEGANHKCRVFREMAIRFACNSLSHYMISFLKHYGITKSGAYEKCVDFDDYLQELKTVIVTELAGWNPKYNMTTYFERLFKNKLSILFAKNENFSSVHYGNVMIHINKAKDSLAKKGIENPSYEELKKQMAEEGHIHSIYTIRNTLRQSYDVASLEKCAEQGEENSLLANLINEGETDEELERINAVVDELKPLSRNIIESERTLYSRPIYNPTEEDKKKGIKKTERHVVTSPDLLNELIHLYPGINIDWVIRHRSVAESEFAHKYSAMFKAQDEDRLKISI